MNEAWTGHPSLKIIKSVNTKFKNLACFKGMEKLEELYLARNNINAMTGYGGLPSLKRLHLRKNKIEKIEEEMEALPALQYLNLRSNSIADKENLMRLLWKAEGEVPYPELKDLNIINTPLELSYSSLNVFIA